MDQTLLGTVHVLSIPIYLELKYGVPSQTIKASPAFPPSYAEQRRTLKRKSDVFWEPRLHFYDATRKEKGVDGNYDASWNEKAQTDLDACK